MNYMNFDESSKWDLNQSLSEYINKYPQEMNKAKKFAELLKADKNAFERDLFVPGHFTSSAWVVSECGEYALMAHHKKLNKWLQLGGHADGDSNLLLMAQREVLEEGGLKASKVLAWSLAPSIFDLDIHDIPVIKKELAHQHFDCRFLFRISKGIEIKCSDESNELKWVKVSDISEYTDEESILRMISKFKNL